MEWAGIAPKNLTQKLWSKVGPYLVLGLDPLDSLPGVRRKIEKGEAQLWMITEGEDIRAVLVTNISQYDKGRVLTLAHCAGTHMRAWIKYQDVIEAYARESGCDYIRTVGRPGWERVLPGFEKTGVVLEKSL
jgi:hypothetical protein